MKTGNKPSVKRISEITGFSPATVSNALNMKRGVNKDTAERIFQVAGELGYFTGSKSLKSIKFVQFRRNGGIIDDSPFHPAVIEGVEEAARENGLATIYIRLNYTAPDYLEQVSQLTSDSNGGVILLATEMLEEDFDPFMHCKCPIILLDGWCERQPFNGVLINNIDSAQNAVGHLIARGTGRSAMSAAPSASRPSRPASTVTARPCWTTASSWSPAGSSPSAPRPTAPTRACSPTSTRSRGCPPPSLWTTTLSPSASCAP